MDKNRWIRFKTSSLGSINFLIYQNNTRALYTLFNNIIKRLVRDFDFVIVDIDLENNENGIICLSPDDKEIYRNIPIRENVRFWWKYDLIIEAFRYGEN